MFVGICKKMKTNNDDKLLLDLVCQNNDRKAFQSLFERHYDSLFLMALRKLKSRDLAQDLVQETFINFWNYREKMETVQNLEAYLATMLKYQFFKNLNSRKIIFEGTEFLENTHWKTEETGFSILEFKELYALIETQIERLPSRSKAIFLLHRFENKSVPELAQQFGITESTVRNHLNQTQNKLKSQLQSQLPGLAILIFLLP